MSLIWKRGLEARIGGMAISRPRISARIHRDTAGAAKCSVSVYNLAPETERLIQERRGRLLVRAGYGGRLAQVFDGPVSSVRKRRSPGATARILWVEASSEDRNPNNPGGGAIVLGYAGKRSARAIARDIASKAGLRTGPLDAIPAGLEIPFSISATAADAMDDLMRHVPDAEWYISDGELRVTRARVADRDANSVTVSPATGLIGVPDVTDEGRVIRTFCNPAIRMGTIVTVESEALSGTFKTVALSLSLDNWDGAFETRAELGPLE